MTRHQPACDEHWCYCADQDDPDPVCDCGEPGWMCRCDELVCRFCGEEHVACECGDQDLDRDDHEWLDFFEERA